MNLRKIYGLFLLLLCVQATSFAQTKISCVGNSMQLANMLGNNYKVVNCGRSGDTMLRNIKWGDGGNRSYWGTTDHGYGQAKNERPDIVIIALGTNDAGGDVWNSNEAKAGYGSSYNFRKDYTEMINEFKAINGNVKVYICLPPTIYANNQNNMDGWHNKNLEDVLMPIIRQVAAATGATLIDLHTITRNHRNDLYNDDLHPNQKGQTLLAQTIYNAITKVGRSIVPFGEDKLGWRVLTELTVSAGETFALGPHPNVAEGWSWTGPNGFTSNQREIRFENATTQQSGEYVANYNGEKATIKVNVLNTTAPKIVPYVSSDGGNTWPQTNSLTVNQGAKVSVGPQASVNGGNPTPVPGGSWTWTGPDNFRHYDREFTIDNISYAKSGTYTLTYVDPNGLRVSENFNIIVSDPNAPVPNITPYVSTDGRNTWPQTTNITVALGSTFFIGPQADQNGTWSWTGPDGFKSNEREISITNVTEAKLGNYVLTFTSDRGKQTVVTFSVTSNNGGGGNDNPGGGEIVPKPEVPTTGQVAYRLKNGNNSLFVKDASPLSGAQVVEWVETDVAAQQWFKVDAGNNQYRLQNVYSGLYLTNGLKQTGDKNDNSTKFNINGNSVSVNGRNYTLEEVPAQDEYTPELRDRVIAGYLAQFMVDKGGSFMTFSNGGWGESENLEVILDAYEVTGNKQYLNIFEQCYAYFKDKVGDRWNGGLLPGKSDYGWWGDDYNDDVMWQIILAARGYKLTGNKMYLDDARRNFDIIWDRAYLGYVGLLRWAEKHNKPDGTGSCINGPAEVAACYIAEGYAALGDNNTANSYWNRAKELYSNHRIYLANLDSGDIGKVLDSVTFEHGSTKVKEGNGWASTYNQGTMLGGAVLLHKHFGDNLYKSDAEKIYTYTQREMANEYRVIKQCETTLNDGSLQGFKGILMRYIRNYYEEFGDDDARSFLLRNAFQVYNNRNKNGFGLTNWRIKAPEDYKSYQQGYDYGVAPFSAGTVMSAAVNAPIFLPTGERTTVEVENMNLSGDAAKQNDGRASNGAYVNGIGSNGNNKATFTYNAPAAGKYIVDVYYSSGANRYIQVSANGRTSTVRCMSNGAWDGTTVTPVRVLIDLNAGQNTITLGNNNDWGPNLDKVVVAAAVNVDKVLPERAGGILEAEDAELNGNVHIEYSAYASRRIGVGNIGNNKNSLTFHYYAPQAGEYEIEVHYSSGLQRDMYSQVNNGQQNYETYAPSNNSGSYGWDYSSIATKKIKVQLQAGENTIKFGNERGDGQYAPDLDYIV